MVVVVLVVVLVVAGAAGGFLLRAAMDPAGGGAGTPGTTPPAVPVAQRFDPAAGLGVPDGISIIGRVGDIVVFLIQFVSDPARDPGDYVGQYDVGRDLLRGVDATTGRIVWTYDRMPANTSLSGTTVADGKLALTWVEVTPGEGTKPWSCVATSVLVLSIPTGETVARQSTPVPADCWNVEYGSGSEEYRIAAYQDGLLALTWHSEHYTFGQSLVFRDSDLAHPVWQADGAGAFVPDGWYASDSLLPGGWFKSQSGPYVALKDGSASGLPYDPYREMPSRTPYRAYFAAGDRIIGVSGDSESGPTRLTGYDSGASKLWTYQMPDSAAADTYNCRVAAANSFVFASRPRGEGWPDSDTMLAIDLATGRLIWSVPVAFSWASRCDLLSRSGDQQVIVVAESRGIGVYDSGTGARIGAWNAGRGSDFSSTGVEACGVNRVCVYSDTGESATGAQTARLTVLDFGSDKVEVVYDQRVTSTDTPWCKAAEEINRGRAVLINGEGDNCEFMVF